MKENTRKSYLDFLKIFACFAVIIMHLTVNKNTDFINWSILKGFNVLGNFAVPIFVMISGALLLSPKKEITIKNIFFKYILRLIISLVIINTIIGITNGIIDQNLSIKTIFINIYNVFLNRAPVPYWYLYMMAGLYIITPVLKEWIKKADIKNIEYFLIIFITYRIIIYTLLNIPNIEFLSLFQGIYSSLQLPMVTGYCGYYILGYYLSQKDFSKIKTSKLVTLLFIVLIITIGLEIYLGYTSSNYINNTTVFMDVFSINIFLISILLFIIAKNIFNKPNKLSEIISSKTYGIYLFHVLGLQLISKINLNINSAIIYIQITTILVFTFSYICTFLMQKIPYIGKYFK